MRGTRIGSRWILHALALIAALLAAPALYAQPEAAAAERTSPTADARARWRSPASWQRLRLGMSQGEVLRILGDPGRVTVYYGFTRWEYPDALGLRVNFDDHGRLIVWGPWAR